MVTIRDVAKRAGVTIGTVSRVFNRYPKLLPETVEKVERAARELRYIPNANARSLSSKRPPNLCLIASGLLGGDDRDAMTGICLKGILEYTTSNGLEMSLYCTDSQTQTQMSFTDYCRRHAVSCAIVTGIKTDDPYFVELVTSGIPVVGIDLPIEGEHAGWVSVDNAAASREAVEILFSHGMKKLLIVAGKSNAAVNTERLRGVHAAFERAGLPLPPVVHADFDEEKAYRTALERFAGGERPDAVFCFSDLMALGVMRAAREAGLRVPEDLSVMGFDGMPFCAMTQPTLSTVRQDMRALGFEAAHLAHDLMRGRNIREFHRFVPYRPEMRGSVRT